MANTSLATELRPTRQRWVLAAILLIVVFFSYIDRVNVSILMADNAFMTDMGIQGQAVQKGMLMTVFLAAYGLGNVFLSPLGDIIGPRKAMSLAVVIWAISLIIGGLAPTFAVMLIARVILGLGEGMHFPMQSKYIKHWYPPQERGKANAVWQTGMAIAPAIAMPFFAWIIYYTGWRNSFFVLTMMGILPLLALWFYTADTPRQDKRVNALELEHIESGLAKEAATQTTNATDKDTFWDKIRSFSGNYQFWLMVIYYNCHLFVFWGAMTWLPSYLKEARGFSWAAMGALASLPWILGVVTKIVSGYLCDKIGRRAPILVCAMTGVSIGVYFAAKAPDNLTAALLLAVGIGSIGLSGPASWTLLQDIVPGKGISTAAGIMNGVGNFISSLAPLAIGFAISKTGSYDGGLYFMVASAIVGGSIALFLTLKKK